MKNLKRLYKPIFVHPIQFFLMQYYLHLPSSPSSSPNSQEVRPNRHRSHHRRVRRTHSIPRRRRAFKSHRSRISSVSRCAPIADWVWSRGCWHLYKNSEKSARHSGRNED